MAGTRHARAGKLAFIATMMAFGLVAMLSLVTPQSTTNRTANLSSNIAPSQYPIDSGITVLSYSAPNFTWTDPVTFYFTIDSNATATVFIRVNSTVLEPLITSRILVTGINPVNVTYNLLPIASPGNHVITIRLEHGGNNATITHEIWIGSNVVISWTVLFVTLTVVFIIFARVGAIPKPKTSTGSGAPSSASSDGDASTTTFVDQSQAPAGRIFCPECKKVIEEGSIFCPECGTRIPRYLRYHP